MTRSRAGRLAVLLALAGLAGCGDGLHPVEGQVVWAGGQPATELAGSLVCFESTEHRTVSRAAVGADARFQLTTLKPGTDGAPPGVHRVYILEKIRYVGDNPETARALPRHMDPRFGKLETSGLEVTVPLTVSPVVLTVERAGRR